MPLLPDLPQTEMVIVALTNAFRVENKLGAVAPNKELTQAARAFAEFLAKSDKFAHEADGREPRQRAEAQGYKYCVVAENLALNLNTRGYSSANLATEVVEGWKASLGHRRNLLDAGVTEIGVAVAKAPTPEPKFLSVQLFGRPESLKVHFKIRNETADTISYVLAEETHTIDPRTIVMHESCTPGNITFDRAGSWLTGARINLSYEQRNGALFTLRPSSTGVRVEVGTGQ